jgi:pimeloyl-ACP methyl ester carboxylesterase
VEANKKYFKNYSMIEIEKCGHYPMIERPMEFNQKLEEALLSLK